MLLFIIYSTIYHGKTPPVFLPATHFFALVVTASECSCPKAFAKASLSANLCMYFDTDGLLDMSTDGKKTGT